MVESMVAQSTFVPLLSAKPATGQWLEIGNREKMFFLRLAGSHPIQSLGHWSAELLKRQFHSPNYCAASLAAVTSRVKVPTMGDFPFAHLA
jgi:hypothetical protein